MRNNEDKYVKYVHRQVQAMYKICKYTKRPQFNGLESNNDK